VSTSIAPPTVAEFMSRIVDPGLAWVATHTDVDKSRAAARVFLTAVALQESGLDFRAQVVAGDTTAAGPARGWWQFERPTIGLMMRHAVSASRLLLLCRAAWVRYEADDIWRAIEGHDYLALGVARLLLLTDPKAVPVMMEDAWACYANRLWRPGKPHPGTWPSHWHAAQAAAQG
jgi:hypothetical protein